MIKKIVPIKGMHCRSCEILIAEKLKEIPDVSNVRVSWKKKEAEIYSSRPIRDELINKVIIDAGYSVGLDDEKKLISSDPSVYFGILFSAVILYFIYTIARALGFNGISTSNGNPSSLLVVGLVGLTAGISTCMALVGGLILGISARHSEKHPEATALQKFRPHLFFNLGRIASYTILGGVIGLIGKAFRLNGPTLGLLTIIVGLVMLVLGLQLVEVFPRLSNGSISLPSGISRMLGIRKKHEKEYSHWNSALIGALTFFMPCGFTQAMQLYAVSTGSFVRGTLIMGIFALGTTPGLLGIGGLTSVLKGAFAKRFFAFTGVLVISLAFFNIANGYNLTGLKKPFSSSSSNGATQVGADPSVKLVNGVQEVRMDQLTNGYSPNKFTVQKGIPVKWIVNSKGSGSCSSSILMPKYNIQTFLSPGENIINFTPTDSGDVRFSCSMGMYGGKFQVVEATSAEASQSVQATQSPSPSATATQSPSPAKTNTQVSLGAEKTSTTWADSGSSSSVQSIKTTFASLQQDISPNKFTVTAGKPVKMEIAVDVNGSGCMSTIMIPGIVNQPELLEKGKTITWEFTPKAGVYDITCAMGVPRGILTAV